MARSQSARRTSFTATHVLYTLLIVAAVLGLFFYWFGKANRYEIFLYGHLDAHPFDNRTVSRYWMAGLVAAGIVSVGYGLLNWLAARGLGIFGRKYTPPNWLPVWLYGILPVGAGIVWITVTQNTPVLPLPIALRVAAIAILGLAPALAIGTEMAFPTWRIFGTFIAAGGIVPVVLLLRAIELPAQGILSTKQALGMAAGGVIFGIVWLTAAISVFNRQQIKLHRQEIILFGGYIIYEILPLVHYLFLTPAPYHYITVTDNFFAKSWVIQSVSWLTAIGGVVGAEYIAGFRQRNVGRNDGIKRTHATHYR